MANWKVLAKQQPEASLRAAVYQAATLFHVQNNCILNCFMLSSLPCLSTFCHFAVPTSCYIIKFLMLLSENAVAFSI